MKKRHGVEQIAAKLRQADVELASTPARGSCGERKDRNKNGSNWVSARGKKAVTLDLVDLCT